MLKRLLAAVALAAVAVGLTPLATNAQTSDETVSCPGCGARAEPPFLEFPPPPPSTCFVRFNFIPVSGRCKRPEPTPTAPCNPDKQCEFSYTVICMGDCTNVVQGLYALGGAIIPLFTPCGQTQYLGQLGCGSQISFTAFVYDLSTGTLAVQSSNLICDPCAD